ncbi:MAG: ferrochelatase, partial [Acidobacteria bacterium]|nr:ferrochelatase [Acidobacteriota bacterium]
METTRKRVGVVLFQLGGPDSLETVEPFLYNLFRDPDIIQLMFGNLLRRPLARYIARKRWEHAANGYKAIGNRSPILPLTQRQARALERALQPYMDPRVVIAMRYWHPLTDAAAREIQEAKLDEVVLLPLYPQYSISTTGSSFNEWNRHYRSNGVPLCRVVQYHDHPLLIDAFVEKIAISLRHFRR